MWWLSELGWAGLEDGVGWPPCRFVLGFLSEPRIARIARMGGMARRFVALVIWAGGCAELSEPGWAGLKDGQDAAPPFWLVVV